MPEVHQRDTGALTTLSWARGSGDDHDAIRTKPSASGPRCPFVGHVDAQGSVCVPWATPEHSVQVVSEMSCRNPDHDGPASDWVDLGSHAVAAYPEDTSGP
jgi:hypothetical protein